MLPHVFCSTLANAFRARHSLVALPYTNENLAIAALLLRQGFLLSLTRGTSTSPLPTSFPPAPMSDRRIWVELKYRADVPVLRNIELVSKPSKKIWMDNNELWRLCTGRRAQFIRPLQLGEMAVVQVGDPLQRSQREWMEIRDAVRAGKSGEVICRAR